MRALNQRGQALVETSLSLPVLLILGLLLIFLLESHLSRLIVEHQVYQGALCLASTEQARTCCGELQKTLRILPARSWRLRVCQKQPRVAVVDLDWLDVWGFSRRHGFRIPLPLSSRHF